MSVEENKAISRRFHESFDMAERGPQALYDKLAPNYVGHFPGFPGPLDRDSHRQLAGMCTSGFPESTTSIEDEIAADDKVVTRWTYRAVHTGAFQGIPPTGKRITLTGIT